MKDWNWFSIGWILLGYLVAMTVAVWLGPKQVSVIPVLMAMGVALVAPISLALRSLASDVLLPGTWRIASIHSRALQHRYLRYLVLLYASLTGILGILGIVTASLYVGETKVILMLQSIVMAYITMILVWMLPLPFILYKRLILDMNDEVKTRKNEAN